MPNFKLRRPLSHGKNLTPPNRSVNVQWVQHLGVTQWDEDLTHGNVKPQRQHNTMKKSLTLTKLYFWGHQKFPPHPSVFNPLMPANITDSTRSRPTNSVSKSDERVDRFRGCLRLSGNLLQFDSDYHEILLSKTEEENAVWHYAQVTRNDEGIG